MKFNILRERVEKHLGELLSIQSPTGDTKEAVHYLKNILDEAGIINYITPKGALIAEIIGKSSDKARIISTHVDTLGAMVREIGSNNRLLMSAIGGIDWNNVEGEHCYLVTRAGKKVTGTLVFNRASSHNYGGDAKGTRDEKSVEVRLDSLKTPKELGIEIGDFVYIDTRTQFTEEGFVKSRYLDNKAGVAVGLEAFLLCHEKKIEPEHTTYFMVSNYEEVGHGASWIPENCREMLVVDMASPGAGQNSQETAVTICAKDSSGPFDLDFRRRLQNICEEKKIDYRNDIYKFYGSDGAAALRAGHQIKCALIGPGVESSHAYERTHYLGIENTIKLVLEYICEN